MNVPHLEQELQRLLERYERHSSGRLFAPLADCYRKLDRLDEAFQLCVDGLTRHPRYSSGFVILGKIHVDREEHDEARVAFETVLSLDPDNLVALRYLAAGAELRGDHKKAIGLWEQVVLLDPESEEAEARLERLRVPAESEESTAAAQSSGDGTAPVEIITAVSHDASLVSGGDAAQNEPLGESLDEEPEAEGSESVAEDSDASVAPESDAPVVEAPRDPVPSYAGVASEIVTITLADVYYEQGFKSKALEMYRAVHQRAGDRAGLGPKIKAIETELAAIETRVDAAPAAGIADAKLSELESPVAEDRASAPAEDRLDDLRPEPPSPSPSPTDDEGDEADDGNIDHFKSWLDKIKLRES